MSDYIVYKKEVCNCTNKNTVPDKCERCRGTKTYLEEVDLEEALLTLLRYNPMWWKQGYDSVYSR